MGQFRHKREEREVTTTQRQSRTELPNEARSRRYRKQRPLHASTQRRPAPNQREGQIEAVEFNRRRADPVGRGGGRGWGLAVFSQLLGLLQRLGVAEVEEVVDAVGVDPDRPVRGHGAIGGGTVDFGDVPLGLLPVLLLLLRGLRPRPRRLGLRVVGHVREVEGGREASERERGSGARRT